MATQTVLITGATGGIGSAVARQFADEETTLLLIARDESKLADLQDELTPTAKHVQIAPADVRDQQELIETVERLAPDRIDLVIPAAAVASGVPGTTPLPDEDVEEFQRVINTNVSGVFATIKTALDLLAEDARILIPSGAVARKAKPGAGAYGVSKAAVEGLARGFAADIDQPVGIVDPGLVATDLSGGDGRDPASVAGMFEWAATECPDEELDGAVVGLREWKQATR